MKARVPPKDWNEMADGGVIPEGGTAANYSTGSWKTLRPEIDFGKCVHCLLCWWYCPDSSIVVKESAVAGVDLEHCKGCGICAQVCPPKVRAIRMAGPGETGGL